MRDGDIDYSRYTLIELEEALAGINENLYPRNFENLRFAYESDGGNGAARYKHRKPCGTA